MDTLTHALSGALVARATAPRAGRGRISVAARVVAGFGAAAFPDVDVLLAFVSPVAYLTQHRGVTHSFVMLPLWAFLLAWLAAKLGRARWQDYFGVCALALAIHIVGDLITSFGTMALAPISNARFAWNTTFVIDLWFTGIIVLALAASGIARSRAPAVLGVALLGGYVGMQAVLHQRALDLGRDFVARTGLEKAQVSALPRPVSPFNWMVMVEEGERYHYAFVNLLRDTPRSAEGGFIARLDAAYLPAAQAEWRTTVRFGADAGQREVAMAAWSTEGLGFYRWFAAYPAVAAIEQGNPSTCVWFEDLRFLTPGRRTMPFRFGACREAGAPAWIAYKLDGDRRVRL